jgi:hypothetical protein
MSCNSTAESPGVSTACVTCFAGGSNG